MEGLPAPEGAGQGDLFNGQLRRAETLRGIGKLPRAKEVEGGLPRGRRDPAAEIGRGDAEAGGEVIDAGRPARLEAPQQIVVSGTLHSLAVA